MIRRRLAIALAALGAAVAILLLPLPLPRNAITMALEDCGHLPLVFGLCLLLLWVLGATRLSLRARLGSALLAGILFGATTELLQGVTGRDASWLDLRNDSLGALSAVAAYWLWSRRQTAAPRATLANLLAAGTLIGCAALVLVPLSSALLAWRERVERFPTLYAADFRHTRYFVQPVGTTARPLAPQWRAGRFALPVHCGTARFSGLTMEGLPPDWRGWQALRVDVGNPTDAAFELGIHVRGVGRKMAYDERFNTHLMLRARETRRIVLPLDAVFRLPRAAPLDPARIWSIGIFCAGEAREFELLAVALQ